MRGSTGPFSSRCRTVALSHRDELGLHEARAEEYETARGHRPRRDREAELSVGELPEFLAGRGIVRVEPVGSRRDQLWTPVDLDDERRTVGLAHLRVLAHLAAAIGAPRDFTRLLVERDDVLHVAAVGKITKSPQTIGELPGPFSCSMRRSWLRQSTSSVRVSRHAVPCVPKWPKSLPFSITGVGDA